MLLFVHSMLESTYTVAQDSREMSSLPILDGSGQGEDVACTFAHVQAIKWSVHH